MRSQHLRRHQLVTSPVSAHSPRCAVNPPQPPSPPRHLLVDKRLASTTYTMENRSWSQDGDPILSSHVNISLLYFLPGLEPQARRRSLQRTQTLTLRHSLAHTHSCCVHKTRQDRRTREEMNWLKRAGFRLVSVRHISPTPSCRKTHEQCIHSLLFVLPDVLGTSVNVSR